MRFAIAFAALVVLAVAVVYPTVRPKPGDAGYCTSCHEMRDSSEAWLGSAHRGIPCSECHGGMLQAANARRFGEHARGQTPTTIRFHEGTDVEDIEQRCRKCHQKEYAAWHSGPHAVTYSEVLTDQEHNRKRMLTDDCLRCHGMQFQGSVRDLVTPIDTKGPWRMVNVRWAGRAAIPCITCHEMHRTGQPEGPRERRPVSAGALQPLRSPSLALFDRRTQMAIPVDLLPLPAMRRGDRLVKMSPDVRQALCYQCHASGSDMQVGEGDDRTPAGIHEGISCLACHDHHGEQTRASCANCHPKMSNCGLDVERMDTTFRTRTSSHNIHYVQCIDCHTKGVPKKRVAPTI